MLAMCLQQHSRGHEQNPLLAAAKREPSLVSAGSIWLKLHHDMLHVDVDASSSVLCKAAAGVVQREDAATVLRCATSVHVTGDY